MKPVDENVTCQIFSGISKEGLGRASYLKARNDLGPADKFNYQCCSSWDYGWDVGSFQTGFKPSVHSRSPIVKDTFYRPNGVKQNAIEL